MIRPRACGHRDRVRRSVVSGGPADPIRRGGPATVVDSSEGDRIVPVLASAGGLRDQAARQSRSSAHAPGSPSGAIR